jgi:hypothetical protein
MDTSSGDSTEKSKTFIILCFALAFGVQEAAAMSAGQVVENRQIWEDTRQNRQEREDNENNGPAAPPIDAGTPNPRPANDGERVQELALDLPKNLRVPANMRPMLIRMLQRSETFRRQIAFLSRKPAVRVSVAYGGLRGDRHYQALSTVRKHEWGAMIVDTQIFVPSDVVEIIAHELEHVCEQMEGVDLPALSRRRGVGVFDLNGHFETTRAIRAGQAATREYQDGPDSLQQTIRAAY